jgi:Xaa-Pro aminopeptidase
MNSRINKLKSLLEEQGLDATLISSVPNIIYLTNFAHFSSHEREAFLLITKENQYILTDPRYSHAVRKHIQNFDLLEISPAHSLIDLFKELIEKENIKNLGVEATNITLHESKKIEGLGVELKHFDLSPLRIIKDGQEVARIKKACELGDQAFAHIINHIKEGMTEKEVAFELEHFIRKQGAEISFSTIIAFEENAAIPHHKTGSKKLETGNLILLDFGVQYENYCSDMTRTICLGKASEEKKKIHQTVLDAQSKAIEFLNSQLSTFNSVPASEADRAARDFILSKDYPSIPHSLGHGIGLEVHESPSLSTKSNSELKEGMVFSIEPGIYLNDNCGVRIEDLFTIQAGKLAQLTNASKELIEI